MNGRVTFSDFGVLEQVNMRLRAGADVGRVPVEDELLARDQARGNLEPAALGGVFDEPGADARDEPNREDRNQTREMLVGGPGGDGVE
jgi:hypothetical protein